MVEVVLVNDVIAEVNVLCKKSFFTFFFCTFNSLENHVYYNSFFQNV